MSAKGKKPAPAPEAPREARRLAEAHGADPDRLLAWGVRPDGRVVIITADGKKFSA